MSVDRNVAISTVAICTLWEGDYHKGVGALVNSLYALGFRGKMWAGYRGALPDWASGGAVRDETCTCSPAPGLDVIFVKLETTQHFAHYKPMWCKQVLEAYDPDATGVYYFDPDIIALARWSFFESWIEWGIAVCEDSHYPLHPNHPTALGWKQFAAKHGLKLHHTADAYLNSGLVGLKREHITFLDEWAHLMAVVRREFGLGEVLEVGTRVDLFHLTDQDTFTLTSWTTKNPVSRIGVDAMAFDRGGWVVDHAVFWIKPWRRRPMHDLLQYAIGPDKSLRLYWDNISSPIPVESAARKKSFQRLIAVAAFLGRFYRRPKSVY